MRGMVTITVNEGQFYSLPPQVTELFRVYGTHRAGPNRDTLCIELPEYRWSEIKEKLPADLLANSQ